MSCIFFYFVNSQVYYYGSLSFKCAHVSIHPARVISTSPNASTILRVAPAGWSRVLLQTIACEDGEALQRVFIGYNGSVWQWFFLCLRETAEWCFEEFGAEPAVYEKKQNWLEAALGEDCFPEKHSILFGWGDCLLVLSRVVCANCGRVCVSTSSEHLTVDRSG